MYNEHTVQRNTPTQLPWNRKDRPITEDELTWLQSPQGCSACKAMAHDDPADTPAAVARWRRKLQPERVAAAWNQVRLRILARDKFARADEMFFDRVALEQATDEVIAQHKAKRFAGVSRVADLCCGIGGETIALASVCDVTAVDRSPVRVRMTEHNVSAHDRTVRAICSDVANDRQEADAINVDPDRRPKGPRRHDPAAGSPDLRTLVQLVQHHEHAAIKLSPGVDFDMLPFDAEIELISHHRECKQAIAWIGRFNRNHRTATVLPAGESISASKNTDTTWPQPQPITPGSYLYEPDSAVIRANLVGLLAQQQNLNPIDEQIAYLTADHLLISSFATAFRVIDVTDFSVKKLRPWLTTHNVESLDIKTRGFAASPEDIIRSLKLNGTRHATLFLTRQKQNPIAILAERLP